MRLLKSFCIAAVLVAPLLAQDGGSAAPARAGSQPSEPAADADARHNEDARAAAIRVLRRRFTLVATSAIGYFHSADSVEASLRQEGMNLRGDTIVTRLLLERALDRAESAIGKGDFVHALEALDQAEALVVRFAQKLGG